MSVAPDLAVFYEHPDWFTPLFAELDRRKVRYVPVRIDTHHFAIDDGPPPAPVVFSRLAMSSYLRQGEHALFYTQALFDHWRKRGAQIINGSALSVDVSKARQLSLIRSLGLGIPETRVVHRRADVLAAAQGLRWPLVVKVNVGGSGAGISRYDTPEQLQAAVEAGTVPASVDGVSLVQEYVPSEGQRIVRVETLDGYFLYAIALDSDGATFDLCPADACMVDKPTVTISRFEPDAETIAEAEAIAQAAGLEVGGIEYLVDRRDGVRRWYDINALSNFVAKPLDVLGHDPHEALVDFLIARIEQSKENG